MKCGGKFHFIEDVGFANNEDRGRKNKWGGKLKVSGPKLEPSMRDYFLGL